MDLLYSHGASSSQIIGSASVDAGGVKNTTNQHRPECGMRALLETRCIVLDVMLTAHDFVQPDSRLQKGNHLLHLAS